MKKYIYSAFLLCLLTGSLQLMGQEPKEVPSKELNKESDEKQNQNLEKEPSDEANKEPETDPAKGVNDELNEELQKKLEEEEKKSRVWEFGVGASLFSYSRVNFTKFENQDASYIYHLSLRHLLFGGNLYVAAELNKYLFLDIQGTLGWAPEYSDNKPKKNKAFGLIGPGLQWRLSPYLNSRYVEPYFRVGINYFHRGFTSNYSGQLTDGASAPLDWKFSDEFNKGRANQKDYFPFSLGFGINAWMNKSLAFGLQFDYVAAFYNNTPHMPQVTARIIYRVGSKQEKKIDAIPEPIAPVECIEVEKIVIQEVFSKESIYDLIKNVNFEFDKWDLTPESELVLDEAAEWLKQNSDSRFLISGFTDARGSHAYNEKLSQRRAAKVVEALEKRGVPVEMIKSRGVGKRATTVSSSESQEVRLGDRKVTIERITKMPYWNKLRKRDY